MTPKERVLTTLEHKEPDKVPKLSSFTPEFANRLREHFKMDRDLFNPHGGTEHDLELRLGNDILLTSQGWANSYYQSLEEGYTDEWGIDWRLVEYSTAHGKGKYTEVASHPLADDMSIDDYIPPDPAEEEKYKPSMELIQTHGKEYPIMGVIVCTIFETAWALRGLDRLMMDFVLNEELANRILDIPFNYHLYAGKRLVEIGVDLIWTGDDMGAQDNMVISPEIWRKYFKPRMAKLYSELKSLNPSLKIAYHTDGCVYPIIDDLVEIGLDILNPIQPKSMDPYKIKKKYGKDLTLWGTVDIQETLPFGTTEDVKKEVIERIGNLAGGGGFIISPTHHVQIDTPLDNFFAFWNTAEKYGKYPIKNK